MVVQSIHNLENSLKTWFVAHYVQVLKSEQVSQLLICPQGPVAFRHYSATATPGVGFKINVALHS